MSFLGPPRRAGRAPTLILAFVAGLGGGDGILGRPARAQLSDIEREWRTLQQAQTAHTRGREAAERGDRTTADAELQAAAELYRQLLEQNPLRRDLYAPLADTLVRRGNPAAAYALLSQQVRGGNRDAPIILQLIRALEGMRRYRHALDEAQKLAAAEPKNLAYTALVGTVAAEAGDAPLALQALGQALAKPPSKGTLADAGLELRALQLLRARLLLQAKRPAEVAPALANLEASGQAEALYLIGQADVDSGKSDEAAAVLRRCLQAPDVAPVRSRATALLGQALAAGGHTREAIAVLRQAGDDPVVLLALARLYLGDQPPNAAAALMVVDRAAEIAPKDGTVCMQRASLLEQNGRTAPALAELERCTNLGPSPAGSGQGGLPTEALVLRGELLLRLGRLDDAIADLRQALGREPGSADLSGRLSRALMRRGLGLLPTGSGPVPPLLLPDLEEARRLGPSPLTDQALALGLLAVGKAREALALLTPLCEKSTGDGRLLGACGRALRESGQATAALPLLARAESVLPAGPSPLRTALRQEQAATLIALGRPLDALKLIEGGDAGAQRTRALALLAAVRAFYATPPPPRPKAGAAGAARGPFPPLRQANEAPQQPQPRPLATLARGPFPPLRGPAEQPLPPGATPQTQGLSEERQVLTFAQQALRAGALTPSERAEATLYQVIALVHGGQSELALKLLGEVAVKFDLQTLDALLGPGGFADLKARLTLRGGDFYQGVGLAQQALPLLQPAEARALQNTMAAAYTNKAIDLMERNEVERANSLLRAAWTQSQGGPPDNLTRANYNLAALQLYRGKLEDARAALTRLDPQALPAVWLGLGSYHDLLGDGREALEMYRRYLAASVPGDPQLSTVRQWVDLLERIYEGAQP